MAVMELARAIHPSREILRELAQGRLEADEVAALEDHLADCQSCCLLLEETPDDSFVGRLREARDLPSVMYNTADLTLSDKCEEPAELAGHPRYRLIRLLGRGGMGAVYLAEHRHMARPVALKVINPELLNRRGSLARFQQEARTAAKLDHPNIVAAYDADQAGSLHFLVMEYVEGQNLGDYLQEKCALPVAQACDIIRQAARGLQHAHERGMVHRDIKPHNLMLTPSGQVKVLDFGLARFAAEPASAAAEGGGSPTPHLTGAGAVMGSADYIAPEQARDAHAADCRSDIYSLGCTLYHLLTNQPPFPEGTAPEKLERHGAADPRRLTALRPDVPNALAKVVAKMMAKRPEDRYQSAADVAQALTPFTKGSARKSMRLRARVLAVAGVAMLLFALVAAAGVVRLSAGDREIVIETDDPTVEVVVKGERIVRIVDPKTGKAYQLDRNGLTLSLADDPDGLAVVLDGARPLVLKRQGKRIATVRVAEPALAEPAPIPPVKVAATPPEAGDRSVQLDITVAQVNRVEARRLAARWIDAKKNEAGKQQPGPVERAGPIFGVAKDRDGFVKDLEALRNKNLAMTLAEPRIITKSGRTAWFAGGAQTPIPILTTSADRKSSVTYKQYGTLLSFLPVILRDGKIQLHVHPEISHIDKSLEVNVDGTSIPGFRLQSVDVAAQVESGQTLILAGLIENRPNEQENELIVLVTPRVIDPAPEAKQQVQMHVTVARVQAAAAKQLSTRWLDDGGAHAPGQREGLPTTFGTVKDREGLLKDLMALRDKGLAKVLSEPTLITLSGRPCTLTTGAETPIVTTSDNGARKVTYRTIGTVVNFLSTVMKNGVIHLEICPELSNISSNKARLPAAAKGAVVLDIRHTQTCVEVESGKCVALSGLIENAADEGAYELIILVTPHLLVEPPVPRP